MTIAFALAVYADPMQNYFPEKIKTAAIVLRSFNGAKKREKEVISKLADMVTCPVFAGYPYGHTPQNSAIDMRRQVSISADGILTWL